MTAIMQQIAEKYQGSVPQRVINAVEKAATATGADFAQLMEKASTESSFNPSAKSSTSSATGLFQFIDSTWLGMVKQHGTKLGLGQLASQIQIKDGKPCVANCTVKKEILALRKNPEISAMMAGMESADDQNYLQSHTDGPVGGTEMYLAHFMGPAGASKFLNARADNGSASAAHLFPKEAHANRSIFYTSSGHARTLDQVYDILARKVGDTDVAEDNNGTAAQPPSAASGTTAPASSYTSPSSDGIPSMPDTAMAQALSFSSAGITWDTPAPEDIRSGFSSAGSFVPGQKLSANSIYLLAQLEQHQREPENARSKSHYNA